MKILVVSDSHGDSGTIRTLLDRYKHEVQTVIHLGDNAKDLMQFDSQYPTVNFVAVAGNGDYNSEFPSSRRLTIGNAVQRTVLLVHGHGQNVNMTLDRLMFFARATEVDACLFGHTHMPFVCEHESVFFMNPGSLSQPRGGSSASYGILSVDDDGKITCEVHKV